MRKRKILMVEENEALRLYFRDAFWLHGGKEEYEITFASSFEQAEKILHSHEQAFDVIFLELALHVQNKNRNVLDPEAGLSLIAQIRAMPELKRAKKVVVFSSKDYYEFWKKAKKLGADYFIRKDEYLPLHLVKFVEKIF